MEMANFRNVRARTFAREMKVRTVETDLGTMAVTFYLAIASLAPPLQFGNSKAMKGFPDGGYGWSHRLVRGV